MARRPASSTRDRSRPTARGRSTPARQSLQSRILSRVLVISIAPMLFIGMIALVSLVGLSRSAEQDVAASREELRQDVVGPAVRRDAAGVAREVERLLAERVADVVELSVSPLLVSAAGEAATDVGDALVATPITELEQQYAGSRRLAGGSDAERHLRAIAKRQAVFRQLLFTERNGFTVGSSSNPEHLSNSGEPWWSTAWDDGFFIGPVERLGTDAYGLTVAARIGEQGTDEHAGVVKAIINVRVLQRTTDRIARDSGSDVTLLTGEGELLAETVSDHDASRLLNPEIELDAERAETVERALGSNEPGVALTESSVAGFAPVSTVDGRLRRLLQRFDNLDQDPISWIAVVERPIDAAFAPLARLSDVSDGLSATARTFAIIVVVALLLSLIAAFLVSTRLAQRIVGPLRSLGATARNIADHQLPVLVHRAQRPGAGRDTDLPVLPAVELRTNDEIEDVADAFNIVSSTAADLAADQARSRRNVARMFVSLGRRNQNLLSRQLEFIDRLERDTSDPDLLDDLFRLDHLATRMRRNAESLLVLAGEEPARRWSEPVSLTSVVRGAISEVEDYRRVTLDGVDEAQLAGAAVADVTHLLAELIENATQFSPPDTPVDVVGRRVVDGYALAVVDDGVGMSEEQLEDANRRIDASPMVDRVPSSFLGLFVVGRLAARHRIRVRLGESTTEGVTAKVLLPTALIDPPVPTGVAGNRGPALEAGALPDDAAEGAAAHDVTAAESDADGVGIDVADDTATERTHVSASVVRERRPAFDQTAPPIPGRGGRTWSSEERTSSRAPFDHIEMRGLTDDEVDLRDAETEPDVGPAESDDRSSTVDEHGPDDGAAAGPPDEAVDLGLDLREPSEVRDDRPDTATQEPGEPWSGDGAFDDLAYTGEARYPPVGDSAPTDVEVAEDAFGAEPVAGSAIGADRAEVGDVVAGDVVAEPVARDRAAATDGPGDLETEVVSDEPNDVETAGEPVTTDRRDQPTADDVGAWWTGDLGPHEPAEGSLDDIWAPHDTTVFPADDRPAPGATDGTPAPGGTEDTRPPAATDDDPLIEPAPLDDDPLVEPAPLDDDRPAAVTEAEDDPRDAAPVLEVRRRASRREGAAGGPANGRALLRTERTPAADDAAPSEPSPSRATTNAEVTDEHGVTLTAAEHEARATRDRLSRFQRAVQEGRSQTRSRHNGGEHHDA